MLHHTSRRTGTLLVALFASAGLVAPVLAPTAAAKTPPARVMGTQPLAPELFGGAVSALSPVTLLKVKHRLGKLRDGDPRWMGLALQVAEHHRAKAHEHRRAGRTRAEQAALREAVRRYRSILVGRPLTTSKLDRALFGLLDALHRMGRPDDARGVFAQLIRNHPRSAFVSGAYVTMAESFAREGRQQLALKLYQQAARFPGGPLHGYVVYRQGTCWLALGDARRALQMFVNVIKGASRWKCSATARAGLLEAARGGTVQAYAAVGAPQLARPFFRRVGGAHAEAMLARLQALYTAAGKHADARSVQVQRPGPP